MNRYYLLIPFLLSSIFAFGNPDALWQEANQAYTTKDFNTAIAKYEAILATGSYSKELYYNLGNSYYKQKKMGKAILNYERALTLSPRDGEIQHNLSLANEALKDEIEVLPPFFLTKLWSGMHQLLSSTVWSILSILLLILGVVGISLWLIGKNRQQKKQGFIGGIFLIVMSLLFLALARSQSAQEQDSNAAIIMNVETALRSGPDSDSQEILKLHEGTKVILLDQIGEWYKVKIANGEQGWLEKSIMEKI